MKSARQYQEGLEEPDLFEPVDLLFSKKFLPSGNTSQLRFLAYLLKTAREGHLCVEITGNEILPSLNLDLDPLLIEGAKNLPESLFEKYFVREESRYYLKRNWECEKRFLFHWNRIQNLAPEIPIDLDWLKGRLERETLLPEQKKVILEASQKSLFLLLGGPGTGKTYTARILIKVFLEKLQGSRIALAAPTGKATGNLREALSSLSDRCTITTLHSLLKKKHLGEDFVLVDEASMIDANLMSLLFASIKDGARLILLGDPDQLPPVESGNFFKDLAEKNECGRLTTCLRAEISDILSLAAQVKEGVMIPFEPLPKLPELLNLILQEESKNFRVLTPLRKGKYGVESLNQHLYEIYLQKGEKEIPIMIKVNDPYLELYNGDVGYLNKEEGYARFGDRIIKEYALPHYELAYVHSIHKSQGSEYDTVYILIPEGAEVFGREMLYTAITRAKKKVKIFAVQPALEAVLANATRRLSGFSSIRRP